MTDPAGAGNRLVDAGTGRTATWADLPSPEVAAPGTGPVARLVASPWEALVAVWDHARTGRESLVVGRRRVGGALSEDLLEDGFAVIDGVEVTAPSRGREQTPERLWLLTSGSTGRPKRIAHTLASLSTVSGDLPARRWLNPYAPGSYAWWQVVALSLGVAGQEMVVLDAEQVDDWVPVAVEQGVTAVSGTPTFWRRTLMAAGDALREVPLEQVTLGGEPVDQAVLDQLAEVFPRARRSWIYASTEVGASIVVHDGRAGFPVEWLERDVPGRPRLRVDGDELLVRSPHHGESQDRDLAGEVRTGDRVVVEDGRVLVVGRLDGDEINVGGAKASAAEVRDTLLQHRDVAWARVRGRRAPVVGTVVVAEVVARGSAEESESADLERDLARWCRDRLPEHAVPRRWRFLSEIPVKETLKSDV